VSEFEAVLVERIVAAWRELATARVGGDSEDVGACDARLRHLLKIAADHGVAVPEEPAAVGDEGV
jgi:hypothetical protein